jgi:small-conductance mechanosensitive channel
LVIFTSFGQEADSLDQELEPYSSSEIPSNLVELDLLIQELVDVQQPTPKYQLIVDSLDLFQDTLNIVIQEIDTMPTGVALQILEIQKNRITQFSSPLRSWNNFLEARIEVFEALIEEADQARKKWEVTLKDIENEESSASIAEEIKTRLDSLISVEESILVHTNEIIEYEVHINRMSQQIDQLVDQLDDFLGNRLWARDSAPLWALESDTLSGDYGVDQLKKILMANKRSLVNYYQLYRPSFFIHLTVLTIILILFLRIRSTSKRHPEYQDLYFLYHALKRPLLSSLLVSLIFGLWIYTNEPQVMGEAMIIIAIISVMGIQYGLVDKAFRYPLLLLGFIYVFNYLQSVLPIGTLFQRAFMGMEALVVIAYIIWVGKLFKRLKPSIPYGWIRALVRLIPLATIFIVGSLLSNVVGSVRLSRVLLSGIIDCAALALIYLTAVRILSGMVAYLLRTPYAHVFNLIRENFELLERRLSLFFQYAGFILWLRSTLIIFGFLDNILEWFEDIWSFGQTFGTVTITVGGILGFFMIVIISWWLARILQLLLERELFDRLSVSKGIPHAISTTIYYVFIGLGFLMAVSYAGFDLNQISLVIGALGVGIGFGLQNVISNFVSGLILTFERPINVGDTVEVGPLMGKVSDMGLRSSKVITYDGSEVIVPNSNLVTNEVINWTLSDNRRRLTIPVTAAYGTDPHEVLTVMREAVMNHPKVLNYPMPLTLFDGFGDSSLNFRVLFWVHFEESLTVKSEIGLQIFDALKEKGIEIPIPQRVITMKPGAGFDEANNQSEP